MNFSDALNTIESMDFSVEVNVVSGLQALLEVVQSYDAVKSLKEQLASSEVRERLAERISFLCAQPSDPRYAAPNDTALAVYLWLLEQIDHELALRVSDTVLKCPRLAWSPKVARRIQQSNGREVPVTMPALPLPRPA